MKFRVTFLPVFKPLDIDSNLTIEKQTDLFLMEAREVIKLAMDHTNELISEESDCMGIVIGHEDFFESGGKHIQCVSQAQGLNYFVEELAKLSENYPNILLIPGTIYLSVEKEITDRKFYRQNKSKNYNAGLYVQNISPVFYQGQLLRLIKKGDYLKSVTKTAKSRLIRKSLCLEADFVEALGSNCERLEVASYAEDELEHLVPRVVMFGKTPLPGEGALLRQLDLTDKALFSPEFTIKGIRFGLEICADHQKAAKGEKKPLEGLDIHLLTSFGQVPVYDGTEGRGFLIRADHDSSTILKDKRVLDINRPFEIYKDNRSALTNLSMFSSTEDNGPTVATLEQTSASASTSN
ncbi:hypothetical protein [Legionella cardiaca]|uniref:Uncharacterized protein n=1 Tax=Legionella cardiaca TaxID=1071983 RepID=A0ABY8AS98_9GAMM|nr:hypothetical protein [Legionella cardiaca]WED43403.1 hypothetical protein PXX05_01120 [Legionella cardiaca]